MVHPLVRMLLLLMVSLHVLLLHRRHLSLVLHFHMLLLLLLLLKRLSLKRTPHRRLIPIPLQIKWRLGM